MADKDQVKVAKSDLLAAWAVLENLAVSFDKIGATFGGENNSVNNATERAFQEALVSFLTPELVKAINEARVRLGQYISDGEAETLSERIAYWNYAAMSEVGDQQG